MRKLLSIIAVVIGAIFLLWILFVFPYPSCTNKQIEIMKNDLITKILSNELKLRNQYTKVQGKFFDTEALNRLIEREREKFYKYCDTDLATGSKSKYCQIQIDHSLFDIDRVSTYKIKYIFDEESKKFFNEILRYRAYIVGYTSEYLYFNCENHPNSHLNGDKILDSSHPSSVGIHTSR